MCGTVNYNKCGTKFKSGGGKGEGSLLLHFKMLLANLINA